eukprot:6414733-Pyramimonas_sp.AAC.1
MFRGGVERIQPAEQPVEPGGVEPAQRQPKGGAGWPPGPPQGGPGGNHGVLLRGRVGANRDPPGGETNQSDHFACFYGSSCPVTARVHCRYSRSCGCSHTVAVAQSHSRTVADAVAPSQSQSHCRRCSRTVTVAVAPSQLHSHRRRCSRTVADAVAPSHRRTVAPW